MALIRSAAVLLVLGLLGCAHAPKASVDGLSLQGTDGQAHAFPAAVLGAPATLVVFFSADCPCMHAHDARLRALAASHPELRVWAADSEFGRTLDDDRREATARGYPFPILLDPKGQLADALGAKYATYAVVFDAKGQIQYRGGLDGDAVTLHPDAAPWAAQAVDAVVAGRAPERSETKALGCALKRW